MTILLFCAYIGAIVLANWMIATIGIVPVWLGVYAPAGVYAAGLVFLLRDLLHERIGVRGVAAAILVGAVVSAGLSVQLAVASGVAFLLSELADLAVYAPLRRRSWIGAVVASNTVGLLVDSALFLWLAFGSLEFLAGQIVGKLWITGVLVAAYGAWKWRHKVALRVVLS